MNKAKITIINKKGELTGEGNLALKTVEEKSNFPLWAQAVRVFLSNQRKAHAKAKTRAEVVGSGIKIWRQKGTGRARHGDRQAPIFVGGGVSHGPVGNQNFKLKLNQKMLNKALLLTFTQKIEEKKFYLASDLSFKKTHEAALLVEKLREKLSPNEKVAFLLTKSDGAKKYVRNLGESSLLFVESLSPYFLLRTGVLIVSKEAMALLEKRFGFVVVVKEESVKH